MRRALTAGFVLYLGLGRVLGSPVQVQAPFELNKANIPEVLNIPPSTSEFTFLCLIFSFCLSSCADVHPGSRESMLMRAIVIQSHHESYKVAFCISQTCILILSIGSGVQCHPRATGTGRRKTKRGLDTSAPHSSSCFPLSNCVCCRFRKSRSGLILILPRYREDCDSPLTLTNYTLDHLEEHWTKHIDFVICASRLFHH